MKSLIAAVVPSQASRRALSSEINSVAPADGRRWRKYAVIGLTMLTLVVYYPNVMDDTDIWWHLAYGEYSMTHHAWRVDHTCYSWTPTDGSWPYVTWLADSLFYIVHRWSGFVGLSLLQWLIFLGIAAQMAWFGARRCRLPASWICLGLLFVGSAVNPVAVYIKPELFSLLCFTIMIWLYTDIKAGGHPALAMAYLPLFVFWVNAHGGAIIGLLFLMLAVGLESMARLIGRDIGLSRVTLVWLAAAAALAWLAVLINPYGWQYLVGVFHNTLSGGRHADAIMAYQPLWEYIWPRDFAFRRIISAWVYVIMGGFHLAMIIRAAANGRRCDWPMAILGGVLFVFGLAMGRAIIFYGLFWFFACAHLYAVTPVRSASGSGLAGLVPGGVLALALISATTGWNVYNSWFGLNIRQFLPNAAAGWVESHVPGRSCFNDYTSGGYLLWNWYPRRRVFIDPRYGPYLTTGVWEDYLALVRNPDLRTLRILERKYGFDVALIQTAANIPLIELFLNDPDWRLAFFDASAAVFIKTRVDARRQIEAAGPDMAPEKFTAVRNPEALFLAFYLYCNYEPRSAVIIRNLYQHNVRLTFVPRAYHIRRMNRILAQLERGYLKNSVPR